MKMRVAMKGIPIEQWVKDKSWQYQDKKNRTIDINKIEPEVLEIGIMLGLFHKEDDGE